MPVVGKFNPDEYKRWRDRLPWTNEQIAEALEQAAKDSWAVPFIQNNYLYHAKLLREGRNLSSKSLRIALPYLIKVCGVCGKKALYRRGNEGRCSPHRDVPEKFSMARIQRMEARSTDREEFQKEKDEYDLQLERYKQTASYKGK